MSSYSTLVSGHASVQVYYRLGEGSGTTLTDALGNVNGIYAGSGITYGVTGPLANDADTAVTFAGSSDAAAVGHDSRFDLGDVVSVEFWVKRSATQGTDQNLISHLGGSYGVRFNTLNRITFYTPGNATIIARSGNITDQNWHHVVVTKNGSTSKVYLDGADVTVAGTNITLTDSGSGNLEIGFQGAGTNRFTGSLDELALYSVALSATEVLQHYRTGKGTIALTDSATSTDAATKTVTLAKSDSATATDAATKASGKGLTDSAGAADSRTGASSSPHVDSATATDAMSARPQLAKSDSATATDSRTASAGPNFTDTASASDTFQSAEGNFVVLGDSVTVTDSDQETASGAHFSNLADTVTVTDGITTDAGAVVRPEFGGWVPVRRREVPSHDYEVELADLIWVSERVGLDLRANPVIKFEDEELMLILS